jgi:hypothetical protein
MHYYTKEEEDFIKKHYNKDLSGKEICKILNLDLNSLRLKARNLGVASKRPPVTKVNHNFFSTPSINSSYWAGFIAADGWMEEKNNSVCLCQSDKSVLESFLKATGHTGKIYERTRKIKIKQQKEFTTTEYYVRIRSKNIYNDLSNIYGIKIRKSSDGLNIPKLDYKNSIAYIIGYLDGDGSIFIDSNGKLCYSVTIHENIILWLRQVLNIKISYYKRNDCSNVNLCRMAGRGNPAINFLSLCYNECLQDLQFYIQRKWDIFKKHQNK